MNEVTAVALDDISIEEKCIIDNAIYGQEDNAFFKFYIVEWTNAAPTIYKLTADGIYAWVSSQEETENFKKQMERGRKSEFMTLLHLHAVSKQKKGEGPLLSVLGVDDLQPHRENIYFSILKSRNKNKRNIPL